MPKITTVHPMAPRFSQAVTGVLCLEAVVFQTWLSWRSHSRWSP
ncbi:MAG: hypothetical protein RJQ03_00895 [Miltoncostaeaceae bacterium]